MSFKWTLARKAYVLICVPLIPQVTFLLLLGSLLGQANKQSAYLTVLKEKIATMEDLYTQPAAMRTSINSYLEGDRNSSNLSQYELQRSQMRNDVDKLKKLTADNPVQSAIIKDLGAEVTDAIRMVDDYLALLETDPSNWKAKYNITNSQLTPLVDDVIKKVRKFTDELKAEEALTPIVEKDLSDKIQTLIWTVVPIDIVAVIVLALFFNINTTRRLKILMENTDRLAIGQPLNAPAKGTDEIADLDEVFHKMAALLKEAERKERAMIENAVDVICSLDANGRFLRVSEASAKVWQTPAEELIGQRVIELFAPSQRDEILQALLSGAEKRAEFEFETKMVLKDGTQTHMLWTAQWSLLEETLFCVVHDISERKRNEDALRESEAQIRSIVETMPVGVVLLNKHGRIEQVNPMMNKLFKSANTLIGAQITDLYKSPTSLGTVPDRTRELFEKAMGRFHEVEAVLSNESSFPAEILVTQFGGPHSGRLLGIILDVTERHEIERFKKEFLGVVSHELRNPLTAIRGSLKMMMVGALGAQTEQAQKAITIAERSATRLIGLVNDLLDTEKLEAGKLDMQFELRPLDPILEMSVESVKAFADDHDVKVQYSPTNRQVYADEHRIVQVLINLLSNAIKYSPKGSVVRIDAIARGDMYEVRVKDQGRGIPQSHVNSLFQRFKQVERTDSTVKGGTGLGLAICKAIIEQHLGQIGVESEIGQGSTFWFRLPTQATNQLSQSGGEDSTIADGRQVQPEIV